MKIKEHQTELQDKRKTCSYSNTYLIYGSPCWRIFWKLKFTWVQAASRQVARSKNLSRIILHAKTLGNFLSHRYASPCFSGTQGWIRSQQVLTVHPFCVDATSWLLGDAVPHVKSKLYINVRDLFLFEWAVLFLSLPLSLLPWLFFSFQLGFEPSHINLWYFVQWLVEFSALTQVVSVYIGVLLCCFFSPLMHCHFTMAINNLKDGETLFKTQKVQEIFPSFF